MKFLNPRSALRFGAACLAFVPFAIQVRATNDDGFFPDDTPLTKVHVTNDDGFFDDDPPLCQTIQDIVCNTISFKTFCDALNALDQTDVDETLNQSHITVFVPTNSAFVNLFDDLDFDYIDDFSDNTLEDLLLVHIHKDGFISKDDLEDSCEHLLGMANGDNTRTKCENNTNKIYQKGAGNPLDDIPRIISFDILACNGSTIHVVNRVILPRYVQRCE
jgi:uncharacterized surface protein with fasciclin (FAS1) repeats